LRSAASMPRVCSPKSLEDFCQDISAERLEYRKVRKMVGKKDFMRWDKVLVVGAVVYERMAVGLE
jgi:hypothetical protein